jgi:hypothetical protein
MSSSSTLSVRTHVSGLFAFISLGDFTVVTDCQPPETPASVLDLRSFCDQPWNSVNAIVITSPYSVLWLTAVAQSGCLLPRVFVTEPMMHTMELILLERTEKSALSELFVHLCTPLRYLERAVAGGAVLIPFSCGTGLGDAFWRIEVFGLVFCVLGRASRTPRVFPALDASGFQNALVLISTESASSRLTATVSDPRDIASNLGASLLAGSFFIRALTQLCSCDGAAAVLGVCSRVARWRAV